MTSFKVKNEGIMNDEGEITELTPADLQATAGAGLPGLAGSDIISNKTVENALANGAGELADGAKAVASGIADGASAVASGIADGAKWVGDGISEVASDVESGVEAVAKGVWDQWV